MPHVELDDPCPCGSGETFQDCCLKAREEGAEGAVAAAVDWLLSHHEEACDETLNEDFLGGLEDEHYERLEELPEELAELMTANAFEWLLAEGEIEIDGEPRRTLELVLGPGGPELEDAQRAYLESLGQRGLGLYEVEEAVPGEGLWLEDALGRDQPSRIWVAERMASASLEPGNILATRLLPGDPWESSGALYPFPEELYSPLIQELQDQLAGAETPQQEREAIGVILVDNWLELITSE